MGNSGEKNGEHYGLGHWLLHSLKPAPTMYSSTRTTERSAFSGHSADSEQCLHKIQTSKFGEFISPRGGSDLFKVYFKFHKILFTGYLGMANLWILNQWQYIMHY